MRRTLRTVAPVAFCVTLVMPIVGCRTNRETNEASAPPASVNEAAPAARTSIDGGATPPAGSDATKPVKEPNELRTPPHPPIIYGREADILPLSDEQVRRVKGIVADEEPGKEIWFIYVRFNARRHGYSMDIWSCGVDVFCRPDQQSARVRRGAMVNMYLPGSLASPKVRSFSYAHVCETDAGFSNNLTVPDDLARLPFAVSADISDEDIIEVVRCIRSGPSVPARSVCEPDAGTRLYRFSSRPPDPAASIQGIGQHGEEIHVTMEGPPLYERQVYCYRKVGGIWTFGKPPAR